MSVWQARTAQRLTDRKSAGLWRHRPLLTSIPDALSQVNGCWVLNFASNDYLGLASDATIAEEARELNTMAGQAGSTASHVLAGHHLPHHLLEDELADWLGVERVLLFSSGYLANLAVQTALLQAKDCVIHDKLNHASLIDGAHLSHATFKRYPHGDMSALARRLGEPCDGLRMVVSDGVFSMDGDLAPLNDLVRLTQAEGALLVIDEAHAFGVLGEAGKGSVSHAGLPDRAPLLRVGTLGKAFASSGAFIAGDSVFIESITQFARSYIYTTAQPPYQASLSRVALRRVVAGDALRAHLVTLIQRFRAGAQVLGLSLMPSMAPIQPILLGSNERALAWQERLWQLGIWVPAIRPPTVPVDRARLRISLSARHQEADVDRLLSALADCLGRE